MALRWAGSTSLVAGLLLWQVGPGSGALPLGRAPSGEACLDCHDGIEARTASFAELPFPHAPHVGLDGGCLRCHGEHTGGDMAGVTVARADCRTCHHGSARGGTALCERCHTGIYERLTDFDGRAFPHSVHSVPISGLGCADCHGAQADEVVASPVRDACIACHP